MYKRTKISYMALSALSLGALVLLNGCGQAPNNASASGHEITSSDVKVYWEKLEEPWDSKVYFVDGNTAIPYFEIEDFVSLKNQMAEIEKRDAVIESCQKNDEKVTLVRDNQSECVFDFDLSTIHFEDFDRFVQSGFTDALVSTVWSHETFSDGTAKYYQQAKDSVNRNGYPVDLNLADYDISFVRDGSQYFVPVQTMSDVLLNEMTDFLLFNGENLFIADDSMGSNPNAEAYYSVPKGMRSEELAKFTYNEFAFAMDFNYGQKKEQNITDFRSYLTSLDLTEPLLSQDPEEAAEAFHTLTARYLGGRHNLTAGYSYFIEEDMDFLDRLYGINSAMYDYEDGYFSLYMNGREQNYQHPEEMMPRYEEVGDTAILTFGSFDFPNAEDVDYYETVLTEEDLGNCYRGADIVGLIQYAHKQITRPNSPIENVVIDLSNNVGGDVDAGAYLLSWIMGTAPISVRNTATGAETTAYYQCDANFDRVYDERDNLKDCGKNIYCMVSPMTFSCANYVAAVLKETQSAVILGRHSAGGTCAVQPLSAADGTVVDISGRQELCTVVNGTYYPVDRGVEPDFTLTKLENFYNREKLADVIHSLY